MDRNSNITNTSIGVTGQTYVQFLAVRGEDYPKRMGNQFWLSYPYAPNRSLWVQNMFLENYQEWLRRNKHVYNIEILAFPYSGKCFIIDRRVPRDWLIQYNTKGTL